MILAVTSLKGGTGKSTVCQNLAVCMAHMGYRVTVVDTDANGSTVRWSGLRDEALPHVTVVALNDGNALRKNVRALHENCDVLVIDGTPALSELASTIIVLADVVLIPVKPGVLDVWATEKFLEKYENARSIKEGLSAYFVLTQFDPRNRLGEEVEAVLRDMSIPTMQSKLNYRVAFAECISGGMGVYEYRDPKAKAEAIALTNEVIAALQKIAES